MTLVVMSSKELGRVGVLRDVDADRMTPADAASALGVSVRQVFRLLKIFRSAGASALASRRRGRPSNRRYPAAIRAQAMATIRERYADFGPTLAAEKLSEVHELSVSRETLRHWMIADGLWRDRKARQRKVYQPRPRRAGLGELVQIDGSEHWWFEDRGPQCTLLVYIDDATSRLRHLKFVESESTFAYFGATREYLEAYGKPVAFYSDKHGVFRINAVGAVQGDGMTQYGRALHELNIEIICANTPQAKGRVERANKTLQDRLVKDLRLQGIGTIEAANRALPAFVADFNRRFGKAPRNPTDLHRPLAPDDNVTDAFSWREERTVSKTLTLQYDKVMFILEPNDIARGLSRKRVTVCDYPEGRLAITYQGVELAYRIFDKLQQVSQAAIVENKHLGAVLAQIRDHQLETAEPRSRSAPRRRDQADHRFKVG
jgi:hypothetical protein